MMNNKTFHNKIKINTKIKRFLIYLWTGIKRKRWNELVFWKPCEKKPTQKKLLMVCGPRAIDQNLRARSQDFKCQIFKNSYLILYEYKLASHSHWLTYLFEHYSKHRGNRSSLAPPRTATTLKPELRNAFMSNSMKTDRCVVVTWGRGDWTHREAFRVFCNVDEVLVFDW